MHVCTRVCTLRTCFWWLFHFSNCLHIHAKVGVHKNFSTLETSFVMSIPTQCDYALKFASTRVGAIINQSLFHFSSLQLCEVKLTTRKFVITFRANWIIFNVKFKIAFEIIFASIVYIEWEFQAIQSRFFYKKNFSHSKVIMICSILSRSIWQ